MKTDNIVHKREHLVHKNPLCPTNTRLNGGTREESVNHAKSVLKLQYG